MSDDARIFAYLAVVLVTFIGGPLAFWFARKLWRAVEIAERVEQALMGVEGGRGLVAQVETLRLKSHEHSNDVLALKMRVSALDGKEW